MVLFVNQIEFSFMGLRRKAIDKLLLILLSTIINMCPRQNLENLISKLMIFFRKKHKVKDCVLGYIIDG